MLLKVHMHVSKNECVNHPGKKMENYSSFLKSVVLKKVQV